MEVEPPTTCIYPDTLFSYIQGIDIMSSVQVFHKYSYKPLGTDVYLISNKDENTWQVKKSLSYSRIKRPIHVHILELYHLVYAFAHFHKDLIILRDSERNHEF